MSEISHRGRPSAKNLKNVKDKKPFQEEYKGGTSTLVTRLTKEEKELLKQALQEVKEGKIRPLKELVQELGLEKDVSSIM